MEHKNQKDHGCGSDKEGTGANRRKAAHTGGTPTPHPGTIPKKLKALPRIRQEACGVHLLSLVNIG